MPRLSKYSPLAHRDLNRELLTGYIHQYFNMYLHRGRDYLTQYMTGLNLKTSYPML